jgi:hypothetical protein
MPVVIVEKMIITTANAKADSSISMSPHR